MCRVRILTVDIAAVLPRELYQLSVKVGGVLSERMHEAGSPSVFRLGERFPGAGPDEVCQPHVSIFMLAVADSSLPELLEAVARATSRLKQIDAVGAKYAHNPVGAPEMYFERREHWFAAQSALVAAAAPLRRGRLRDTDPAGDRLAEVVARLHADGSDPVRLKQLLRYGYDEVSDRGGDRFHPHITFAWPAQKSFVSLGGLPDAAQFSATIEEIGVFGMRPKGTCTRLFGSFALGTPPSGPA